MTDNKRAGIIHLKVNGTVYDAKGSFNYHPSVPKREAMVGHDTTHGYKELPTVPFIEGEITDKSDLDIVSFFNLTSATITLELANGKVFVLRDAWYSGDATIGTEEANIAVRFEGLSGEEV